MGACNQQRTIRAGVWCALALLALACNARAAVFVVEQFNTDPAWVDRDGGEMFVAWSSSFGGSMSGSFDAQDTPFSEIDAMQITGASSGGDFVGDYYTSYSGFTPDSATFTFSFYSDDVLPSNFRIRIGSGSDVFSRTILSQATALDSWQTISISLAYAGWLGGSATAFSNAFSSISFIDIQIGRSGMEAQTFYVDNFALNGTEIVDPGTEVVPEVNTLQYLALGTLLFARGVRRRLARWSVPDTA